MARSRRKAREAALQTLYEAEIGHVPLETALEHTLQSSELEEADSVYARRLVESLNRLGSELDELIVPLIASYGYDRIAAVDRNVLRIAAYELFHEPAIPPAVTLNEAIEIAKKFSTAESGKFVNGILGQLLKSSPKATWDPASAPSEDAAEEIIREQPMDPPVEMVEPDEAERLARAGGWKLRSED